MKPSIAETFYNAAGVLPRNDPASSESSFAVDQYREQMTDAIKSGDRVLDIGCNAGRFAFVAEELGAIATGIDCADVPLQHARQLTEKRSSKATFVHGDALKMPFEDAAFDVALLLNNVVEFSYADMETMAKEVHRVLKADGRWCISLADWVERGCQRGGVSGYVPSTGAMHSSYEIPGHGRFQYDAWFWTLGFLKHVLRPWFEVIGEEQVEDFNSWVVFRRRNVVGVAG